MSNLVVGEKVWREFPTVVRGVDSTAKTIDAMVSTINTDRHNEIILPSAFTKRLDIYRRNPLYIWSHNPLLLQNYLGRASAVDVVARQGLRAIFDCSKAVKIHDWARIAFELVEAGILNSFSVGFRVWAWVHPQGELSAQILAELEGIPYAGVDAIYTDVELCEISLCGMPSNRESVVVGRSDTVDAYASLLAALEQQLRKDDNQMPTTNATTHEVTKGRAGKPIAENAVDGAKLLQAQVIKQHPGRADIAARLRAAACTVEGWSYYDEDEDPPKPEICLGVVTILEAVAVDLRALAGGPADSPADPPAANLALTAAGTVTKDGQVLSEANKQRVGQVMGHCAAAAQHCKDFLLEAGVDDPDSYLPAEGEAPEEDGDTIKLVM